VRIIRVRFALERPVHRFSPFVLADGCDPARLLRKKSIERLIRFDGRFGYVD